MATITEKITEELLDAAHDPSGLETVLRQHSRSKGPLYQALAEATAQLQQRFDKTRVELSQTEIRKEQLDDEVQGLEQRCDEMKEREQVIEQQLQLSETRLSEVQGSLDQAEALVELGFGPDELSQLHQLLGQIAASQGALPEEGVAQFFQTMGRYESIVSLDLESKRAEVSVAHAKADAERWEAEAKHKEAKCKARVATIDIVENWFSKGIKEKDLLQWTDVLGKANVTVDIFAKELKDCASLHVFYQEATLQIEELQKEVKETESRLRSLTREETEVKASIGAIRDSAVSEVEQVSRQTQRHLEALLATAQKYGELEHKAARLEAELTLVHAFLSPDPEEWANVPREIVQRLITGLMNWAQRGDNNQQVTPPEAVCKRTTVSRWCRISLLDLLLWTFTGVLTAEERESL